MRKQAIFCGVAAVALTVLTGSAAPGTAAKSTQGASSSAARSGNKQPGAPEVKSSAEETQALEIRRQQLVEKEAALSAKEQELNSLAAKLDARIAELNAAQKGMEKALLTKKKEDSERYRRILKVYKALRPEEAAKLLNKLDDGMVIEMLNQMDQKTAVKLIPFINQPNVLKWTRENLTGN